MGGLKLKIRSLKPVTIQILKGEKFSPKEVLISTTMGPLGAAATEAQAVKALIEQGGKAAIAANAGIGAATNVAGDTATKVITGQSVTAAGAVVAAGSGAFGGVVSTKPVVQGAVTEATGAVLKELTDPEEKK